LENNQIIVKEKILQQDMYYKNHLIMRYTIKYPKFLSDTYQTFMNKLNSLYRIKAVMYERSNIMNLYQMAMVDYDFSISNNYPIKQFEAYVDYSITFHQDCTISLYIDQYEYAGGAHGLTVRFSDTWSLQQNKRMELNELFPQSINYQDFIIQTINRQIELEKENGNSMYFEDYLRLVNVNFKPNNFYLTKEGIVIYFQQYEIAPYASGLPIFVIPYGHGGSYHPKCL
jgi:hypothetical protein